MCVTSLSSPVSTKKRREGGMEEGAYQFIAISEHKKKMKNEIQLSNQKKKKN